MPRILFINTVCNGSTGTICKQLYKAAEKEGFTCCIAFGRGASPDGFTTYQIDNKLEVYRHVLKARLLDASGFGSKHATKKFIKWIDEEFKPDIIHMHNLHGYYLHIETFFDYLKLHLEIKKIWTLHDCWAFTGHCSHYTYAKCDQWIRGCSNKCPNKKKYPQSFISRSKQNYLKKKRIISSVKNMFLVTPSQWLMKEANNSFLKEYPIQVINNGVDTTIFKPTPSDIKEKYGIQDKKVILGVTSVWNKMKGLETFIELSKYLPQEYKIVLIGLNKKQINHLPTNIIGLPRTENVQELVKWYSAAEIYFNPTLEDNYPTTNLEAIACGTPVITFNTGGSPESAFANNSTIIYSKSLEETISKISTLSQLQRIPHFQMMNIDTIQANHAYLNVYRQGGNMS